MRLLSKLQHPIYSHITSLAVASNEFDDVMVTHLDRLV